MIAVPVNNIATQHDSVLLQLLRKLFTETANDAKELKLWEPVFNM